MTQNRLAENKQRQTRFDTKLDFWKKKDESFVTTLLSGMNFQGGSSSWSPASIR